MNAMSGLPLSLRQRFVNRSLCAQAAIGLALLIAVCAAGRCEAQCVEQSDRVPAAVVQAFQSEPAALLREVRTDRSKLTGRLAAYLVTDISILSSVRDLISESSNVERAAIGMALRRAQLVCVPRKPENAQKISQFVQKLADSAVSSGYTAELEAIEFDPNSIAGQTTGSAQTPSAKKSSGGANSLMTGEWSTEIGDPFTLAPLPQ
ncbi:hypothetical protein ACWAUC_27665 [Bradyrhizobium guangdongense]